MTLKVPYYSQLKDTQNGDWKYDSCGIVCVKMVLDFYGKEAPSIDRLYQQGLDLNGYLEGVGWYHHSLAVLAKEFGCRAITRSWALSSDGRQKLVEQGFGEDDTELMAEQLLDEGIEVLKREIKQKHPVIVSVPKNFDPAGSGHLMVLIGVEKANLIFNDPFDEDRRGEGVKISVSEFKKVWTRRAIFIHP